MDNGVTWNNRSVAKDRREFRTRLSSTRVDLSVNAINVDRNNVMYDISAMVQSNRSRG